MNKVKFISDTIDVVGVISSNYAQTVEYCARTCYNTEANMTIDSWEKYIRARVKSGHESVIEHNCITLTFVGKNDSAENILNKLEKVVYEANNLVKPKRGKLNNRDYLIITGNVKMFRDVLKNFNRDREYIDEHNVMFKVLLELLKDTDNVFFYGVEAPDVLIDVVDFKESEFKPFKLINLENVPTGDERLKLDIINIDNPDEVKQFAREISDIVDANREYYGSVTYRVRTPRIISQQDSRHRIQAKSQKSQRYVNESDDRKTSGYYVPAIIDGDKKYTLNVGGTEVEMSYEDFMKLSFDLYKALQEDKVPNETARFVLTNATYTEYCITKPFTTLNHYFYERCARAAQYEVRLVALALRGFVNDFLGLNINEEHQE